jgi:hypothetical protein
MNQANICAGGTPSRLPARRQRYVCYNARVPKKAEFRYGLFRARHLETLGIVLIAVLIFLVTLARFAKTIVWSAR